ncbi:MAG: hypothetical protein EBS06_06355 [Proteobacteria bacterium]|nr:hypothetical protein [Pseudomonadota bacterium]
MFKILRFLFVACAIAISLTWFLDHNGLITLNWLGYQVKTDILTAILLIIIFTMLIFWIAYFSAKIFFIKIPYLSQLLNKKKNDK